MCNLSRTSFDKCGQPLECYTCKHNRKVSEAVNDKPRINDSQHNDGVMTISNVLKESWHKYVFLWQLPFLLTNLQLMPDNVTLIMLARPSMVQYNVGNPISIKHGNYNTLILETGRKTYCNLCIV